MRISFNLFILSVLFCFGCKTKEEAKPITWPTTKLNLDTLWRFANEYSIAPTLNSNKDLLISEMFQMEGDVFKLIDGSTGKLKWKWFDYFQKEEGFTDLRCVFKNDIMVLGSRARTYAFNTVTGKTLWRHEIDTLYGEPQIYEDNEGYIYHGFNSLYGHRSYIYRAQYDKGDWKPVCTFEDSTMHFDNPSITPVAFSKNSKGEKIMVFTLYLFSNKGEPQTAIKVCGFNMVTNKYEWVRDYSDRYVEFMVCKMASNETKVFTYAVYGQNRYLVAINANDGSIAWQQLMPDFGVGIYPYKDKLVSLSNGSSPVICVDQNTGNIVWQQNFSAKEIENFNFSFGDSKVFKNYLFSTQCDYLLVLNLEDGSVVYNKDITLPSACLQFGLDINEEKRLMYIQDRFHINCYKLPDEIKF
jgi:outer membrane protein assembly factor BamB